MGGVLTGFYGMLSVEIMNSVFSKHKTRVFTRKSCVGIKTRILSKTFKICDNPFENCWLVALWVTFDSQGVHKVLQVASLLFFFPAMDSGEVITFISDSVEDSIEITIDRAYS